MNDCSAKAKEANLYIVKQVLEEFNSFDRTVSAEILHSFLNFDRVALQNGK